MPRVTSIKQVEPTFTDVKKWFDEHMSLDVIDLDDQRVYEHVYHAGRWASIFQCTSPGAQRFFVKAKPRSIHDIAALTAIYRPGPLNAHVDKLWIKAGEGEEFDWGDRRINEILKQTRGMLVFQEGVMTLCEQVAGFPKEKSDEARRAILKRSMAGAADAKAAINEMQGQFVEGAVKNAYPREVAEQLYEKIRFFSGYAFNAAHSYSYAIDSYWCAWLCTHFEPFWLCAHLEANSSNPDDRAAAFSQVKRMGYEVVGIDVNEATKSWTILPGKRFMPSFLSCKGIGPGAADEIMALRPFASVESMLFDDDGSWRPSKFNKRGMEALIKVGGMKSLDCVGDGKLFASWRHMHRVVIERQDELKRTSKKDPHRGLKALYDIARETREEFADEWSRRELVTFQVEYFGSVDVQALVGPELIQKLVEKGIPSIDALEVGQEDVLCWFAAQEFKQKRTKNGKRYVEIDALAPNGRILRLKVWGTKEDFALEPFTVCLARVKRDEWGVSTVNWELKRLSE